MWCAFGDTLVSTIPADYPGNNTSGEEASIIDDSIWNPVVISCVSPPILDIITHSDPILPHTVPLEVSFNGGVDFTKGMGSWTYDMDVIVSTLLPATGPVGGGTLVHVEGGPFPANREISCRFRGLPPTKATRLGNDALMCESPELQGVPEKQTVHLASMAYTPAVSCIKVNAAIPSPERHSISTSSLGLADEVQLIQLLWSDIDEVQSISLGQDLVAPRIISLYTAVAENQPTIIDISVLARAANPTLLLYLDALGGEDGGISDTWNITVTGYSGSFSLEWEGLTAELIPYDAESNLLQAMLNAAWFSSAADSGQQGVLVSKDISSGGSIINSWQVTMPSQMGGTLGPIVGYETPGPDGTGIDSVLVTQLTTGSVQEIQKVSALVDPSLGGSFTLSSPFGGWTTGLIPINAEASNLRSHLENTPGIGSVSVSKSVSDTSWFITFLELPGNVPLMSSGGDEIVSVTEVRNGTSFPLSGGVDVSFQGYNPIHIETIDSEEDVISAIESFPGLNNVQVVRSPASGEGLSGGVQFAITIDEFDQEMVIPMLRSYWTVDETGLDGSNAHASIEVENEGTAIAGSFTIKRTITQQSIVLSTSEEKLETIPLKYDSTEHEIEWALDTELGLLNATCERKTEERHTKKGYIWTCVIAEDVNVPEYSLNIDGAGLLGLEAVGNVQWQQSLAASEIQAVSAIPSTSGSFTLSFDGVTTQPLPYNATAGEVEAALRVLPTTSGYITVSRATKQIYQTPLSHEMLADLLEWPWLVEELDQDVVYDAYEWLVTFHGQIGPQDLLKANYEDIVPVKSIFPSDTDVSKQLQEEEAIVVRRVRMGVGEQLGGTWHVTYDGNPSPPIPWNASSHDVEGLLGEIANVSVKDVIPQPVYDGTVTEIKWLTEKGWELTFWDWNDAKSPHSVDIDGGRLTGTNAQLTVASDWGKHVTKEVRVINATNEVVSCSFGGSTMDNFYRNSTSEEVSTVLMNLSPSLLGSVKVTSTSSTSWNITFTQNTGPDIPLIDCGATATVETSINSDASPLGGEFVIVWGSQETEPIAWNADPADVEIALRSIPGGELENIIVSAPQSISFFPSWAVTFPGWELEGDVPLLEVLSKDLDGTNVFAMVTELVRGNQPGGRFSLELESGKIGFQDPYSAWVDIGVMNSTTEDIENALLPIGLPIEVSVHQILPATGMPVAWELKFPRRNAIGSDMTGTSGNVPQLRVFREQLTGIGTAVSITTLVEGDHVLGGSFNLSYNGTSVSLPYNASSSEMSSWMTEVAGLPLGTSVSRSGPGVDRSYNWNVEFPLGSEIGEDAFDVNGSSLLGVSPAIETQLLEHAQLPLDGNFLVIVNGAPSLPISVNSSIQELSAALLDIIPGVHISDGSSSYYHSDESLCSWMVTFSSIAHASAPPDIELDLSALKGSNATVEIDEILSSRSSDVALLTINGYTSGSFELYGYRLIDADNGIYENVSIGPIMYNAMELVDNIQAAFTAEGVEVFIEAATQESNYSFRLLFMEPLLEGLASNLTINDTLLVGDGHALWVIEHESNIEPLQRFTLSLGESCDVRLSGAFCQNASTDPLLFNSSPTEIRDALMNLPEVVEVEVEIEEESSIINPKASEGYGIAAIQRIIHVEFLRLALFTERFSSALDWLEKWAPQLLPIWEDHILLEQYKSIVSDGDLPLMGAQGVSTTTSGNNNTTSILVTEHTAGHSSWPLRTVEVDISINGGYDWSMSYKNFTYLTIMSVDTVHLMLGPLSGGTTILVVGIEEFPMDPRLTCRFVPLPRDHYSTTASIGRLWGVETAITSRLNDTAITCVTPTSISKVPGLVAVMVGIGWHALHGTGFGTDALGWYSDDNISSSSVNLPIPTELTPVIPTRGLFQYHSDFLQIDSVFPFQGGPASGNFTIHVLVSGLSSDMDEVNIILSAAEGGIHCKFGEVSVSGEATVVGLVDDDDEENISISGDDIEAAAVPAVVQIECTAPEHPPGPCTLEVSLNGQDYTNQRLSFFFYSDPVVSRIYPVSGPSLGGTLVTVFGTSFVNTTGLSCRFGYADPVEAVFISPQEIVCISPPIPSSDLEWTALPEQGQQYPNPIHGHTQLFPNSHPYPLYLQRLVGIEVTANGRDFTNSGVAFLYQAPAQVLSVVGMFPIFVHGSMFVNSTTARCKAGSIQSNATFLSPEIYVCNLGLPLGHPNVTIEVSLNEGGDFTEDGIQFQAPSPPEPGYFWPERSRGPLECPPGCFCAGGPGGGSLNFTLCPEGTYQPLSGSSACLRCPIGFHCPERGLHVPRICPAGRVCDLTGTAAADQPCPAGHFCLEGTATTATTCGHPNPSPQLFPTLTYAERLTTMQAGRQPAGLNPVLGARNSICWSNSTHDAGLQFSNESTRLWAERHEMPLDSSTPFYPLRGLYCTDDKCLRLSDAHNLILSGVADWDYSGYALRRPIPCPSGTFCSPGTGTGNVSESLFLNLTAPQACIESMYCPEASTTPSGVGQCPEGFYCLSGKRIACPIGMYCPRKGLRNALPCPSGTFNGQVSQLSCTTCPMGYICPGFGRRSPSMCPGGMVCSRLGLTSPNLRCPPGFYCPGGTLTADPFRNDTTLRPYPCDPGTYCIAGVTSREVIRDDYNYAQPCSAGFFCEAASTSAHGSGVCPRGFTCPEGTAVPIPTPLGTYANLEGMIQPTKCSPGFYAPTIESTECLPCPPGTQCGQEGMEEAEICPPGTYHSTMGVDGLSCRPCPQGTWAKNWELREIGECQVCPTGVVCAVEGMTQPCSKVDFPTPYEPIVGLNGAPTLQFTLSILSGITRYSAQECLRLNDGYTEGRMNPADQKYFFGELLPPFIASLGRGPYIRLTGNTTAVYGSGAQCYRNLQYLGSKIYQRMRDYHGPRLYIQNEDVPFGYGGPDIPYGGFFGRGSHYIDLPESRYYDASFNCTPGFQLRRNLEVAPINATESAVAYTNTMWDPAGIQQRVWLGSDEWFPGNCEADIICSTEDEVYTQADACSKGYVCDESTTGEKRVSSPCRKGYVCDSGATPDPLLEAPEGQFTKLCSAGYACTEGTGLGQEFRLVCEVNHFCPTGTADPIIGSMANDAINRGLSASIANPFLEPKLVAYIGDDDFSLTSRHDELCMYGIDQSLTQRHITRWLSLGDVSLNADLMFLRNPESAAYRNIEGTEERLRPSKITSATQANLLCGRDHKWRLVSDAIHRQECDCSRRVSVIAAVYRLWLCTGAGFPLDDLGIASTSPPHTGGRERWFSREGHPGVPICTFPDGIGTPELLPYGGGYNLTIGPIEFDYSLGIVEDIDDGLLNLTPPLKLRLTWNTVLEFDTYSDLKIAVLEEFTQQETERRAGLRESMDPFTFDLKVAIDQVEAHGAILPTLVWAVDKSSSSLPTSTYSAPAAAGSENIYEPGRLDMCECEKLLRCPNGTESSFGATSVLDCQSTGNDILRRLNTVPDRYITTDSSMNPLYYFVDATPDYGEPTTGQNGGILAILKLDTWEIATITMDISSLTNSMTYGTHYRLAAYVNCVLCPTRYICDDVTDLEQRTCTFPDVQYQELLYEQCLSEKTVKMCYSREGIIIECDDGSESWGSFMAPDFNHCRSMPFFCDDRQWPLMLWKPVFLDDGHTAADGPTQQINSTFVEQWFEDDNNGVQDGDNVNEEPAQPQTVTKGCCQCQPHSLPAFFADTSQDRGFPDNKHDIIQISLTVLQPVKVILVLELLHGFYYNEFDTLLRNIGELSIFVPSRSDYTPESPSTASFQFILERPNFNRLVLPLNLPYKRITHEGVGGSPAYTERVFENEVLIDHNIDVSIGDPNYPESYNKYRLSNSSQQQHNNITTTQMEDELPLRKSTPEDYEDVYSHESWWLNGDSLGPNSFITVPYIPFVSNCDGYGRHTSLARLLETHSECTRVPYELTHPIKQWISVGGIPHADECGNIVMTPSDVGWDPNSREDVQTRGAYLKCTYEENLKQPT